MSTSNLLTPMEMANLAAKTIQPTYICPICGLGHATLALAQACADKTELPLFNPGDLVVICNGYAWLDGKNDWLYDDQGYPFQGKPTFRFWYVVTSVTQKASKNSYRGDISAHRLAYHVQTLGLLNGSPEGLCGWTTMDTHIPIMTPARPAPESVVEAAKQMVGRRFNNLL